MKQADAHRRFSLTVSKQSGRQPMGFAVFKEGNPCRNPNIIVDKLDIMHVDAEKHERSH